jgi:hypothetical protein
MDLHTEHGCTLPPPTRAEANLAKTTAPQSFDRTTALLERLQPITWESRDEIRDALQKHPQWTSELSFINLYAWATVQYPSYCEYEGHILVSYDPEQSGRSLKFLPPIGPNPTEVMNTLARTYGASFVRVDADYAKGLQAPLALELTPDADDYLYTAEQIGVLVGAQASELRRRAGKLSRNHGEHLETREISEETLPDARAVVASWLQGRLETAKTEEDREGKREDAVACERILERWTSSPELRGIVIYHKGTPVSLGIGETVEHPRTPHGLFISHFEKSVLSRELEGLPVHSFQELCKPLHSQCVVNRMQSAGVPGLKVWKDSWGPFGLGHKGEVRSSQ